jgi:hypothetical protein
LEDHESEYRKSENPTAGARAADKKAGLRPNFRSRKPRQRPSGRQTGIQSTEALSG